MRKQGGLFMKKVKVGFIGVGGMAHVHADQLLALENVEITAIADISEEAMQHFKSKFKLRETKSFTDYQNMLEKADVEAIIICSPHTLHFKQATDVLNSGRHVLIEKPMTCSSDEAKQLMKTAEKSGKIMQISYQRHFLPEFIYIRNTIAEGTLGKLTSVTASLYQSWWNGPTGAWRLNPKLSGGGFMMDSGSHIIDVMLWTTDLNPIHIKSQISTCGAPVEIDSFTNVEFEGGVLGGLNLIGCAPRWHETYIFSGEDGAIFYDNGKMELHIKGKEPIQPELPEPVTNQDKSFIDAILGKHEVQVPGEFALKVVEFTEQAYQSAGYEPI